MSAGIAEAAPLGLAEAKAYLRVESDAEDALIAGFVRTATALCEAFTGQMLLARGADDSIAGDGAWRRLAGAPVRGVDAVEALADDGAASALPDDGWASRIDASGEGWVRAIAPGRARVTYRAGLADDWNGVPEPLRQGIARLVAHLHAVRDSPDDAGPPAAVAALWRPWRRVRLG